MHGSRQQPATESTEQRLAYLASFPEMNPNPIVEATLSGDVRYANPAAILLFPQIMEEARAHPWLAGWESISNSISETGITIKRRDIQVDDRWYAQAFHYLPEQSVVRIYGIDITERKRIEDDLRRAEERVSEMNRRLQALMEAVPVGISYSDDPTCRQITGNSTVLNQFEVQRDENLSASAPDPHAPGRQVRFLMDGKAITDADLPLQRAVAENRTIPPMQLEVHLPSGRRWFAEASGAPVLNSEGTVIGGIAVTVDVTERKRANEALVESEQRYREIVETAEEGIATHDPDGTITYVNQRMADMLGYSRQEIIGRSSLDFVDEEEREAVIKARESLKREGSFSAERKLRRKDGSILWTLCNVSPRGDVAGNFVGYLAMHTDLSEWKKAQESLQNANERLREADRRKDEFLAMLAHELRNPLAAISSALELLRLRGSPDPTNKRAKEAAARQAGHMARLLDDLLDVARVTQGKIALSKEPIPLVSFLESAIEASNPFMDARKHQLYVLHPRESMRVHGDRVRLTQAVANLLHNSAKYTPPGGEIFLTVQREGEYAVISVRDNGIGIDQNLLPNVFDLFIQGSRSPDRAEGGLGVGLTLTKSIAELHGGRVEARSGGIGLGSEFRIVLPLLPPVDKQATHAGLDESKASKRVRILVVDDNVDSAEMLSVLLEMEGHEVLIANSGQTGIALALQSVPDVALVDIGMPGMDGYKVAQRMRASPELKEMALIAVSGYGQLEDLNKSREAGFDDHLVKPVDLETLKRVVERSTER
jgi:PAS domain S-box-containing protein